MRILLTGANGYIGKRLLPELVDQGHYVVACVRDRDRIKIPEYLNASVEVIEVDFLDPSTTTRIPPDIEAAYYLIHSMSSKTDAFDRLEAEAAHHFVDAMDGTGVKQIIYLGGIANAEHLSQHLQSRLAVEHILRSAKSPVTAFRAGIIVGSGSASFEIVRDLTEKLPVMITPKWVQTRSKPIAIRNVIQFLIRSLLKKNMLGKSYDIGGPEVLTYSDMLNIYARVRGLKRRIIHTPFLSPKLSSYWLYFVTSTNYNLAVNLVNSMKVEVIPEENEAAKLLSIDLIPYAKAVEMAFQKIEADAVPSSWKDAYASSAADINISERVKVPEHGCFTDARKGLFHGPPDALIETIWSIGGETGWYYANFLWKLRGLLDKLVGGVGLRRGRTRRNDIEEGDALDFWRVVLADKSQRRLLLFAEMKLPGEAWLEFEINPINDNACELVQTATFRPRGILGRLYWHSLVPAHHFVFNGMLRNILLDASKRSSGLNESVNNRRDLSGGDVE